MTKFEIQYVPDMNIIRDDRNKRSRVSASCKIRNRIPREMATAMIIMTFGLQVGDSRRRQ